MQPRLHIGPTAVQKPKLSHSADSIANNDKTFWKASAMDPSFDSLERAHKTYLGADAPNLPRKTRHDKLFAQSVASRVDRYGSADCTSNIFKLQAEELLQNVRSSWCEKRIAQVDAALRRIKQLIEDLPDKGPLTVLEAQKELFETHRVCIPFPEPPPDRRAKYTFSYARPSNINVVGSYSRKTALTTSDMLTVDLAITMPSAMFQEKDYLNYRYFYKRAFYLARIAVGFEESKDVNFDIDYALLNDNHLQPVIIVKLNQDGSDAELARSRCQIRLLPAADRALFPAERTFTSRNCIRSMPGADATTAILDKPTPFYNSSLRSECCSLMYLELLHNASAHLESFNDACILGNIWLRQRGFGAGIARGGFGPFEWACTVALLMQGGGIKGKPILSKGYSSYQVFKAMLSYLSVRNLVEDPTCIGHGKINALETESPLLFDGARGLNILFKMSSWSYELLRYEASRTLGVLSDPIINQFDACFITKVDSQMQRFDFLASFPLNSNSGKQLRSADAHDGITKYCMRSHQLLKRGLDDRALLVNIQSETPPPWAVTTVMFQASQKSTLLIGLTLDPNHVKRTVDRGPSAEEKAAASNFREFWGEKAELRRFKDGSIVESLVWTSSADESVIEQILKHVLRRHLGDEASNGLCVLGKTLDQILPSNQVADPVAPYQPVMTAYEVLERQIRSLEGMPLQIHHVSAGDAQLRYTALSAPRPDSVSHVMMVPANVYVQFEASSRWPDDLAAVQRTKIALLLKLGELLEGPASTPTVNTRLGLESHRNDLLNVAYLDVSYTDGAIFRLRIHHERELDLLQRVLASARSKEAREATASALSAYKRNFVLSPLHTQGVRTMCTRFPLLSPSIRLMKKWRDAHLLSYHVSDELIELLTIRTFVQPYPWAIPGSVLTGFLRTLTFISKWDWRSDPLIVDFSGEMKIGDYAAISTRFEAWRKIDPAMNRIAAFAASNLDFEGISWTELGPSKVVATRLTCLARAACAEVKEHGLHVEAAALFAPSLSDYDFVVHLNVHYLVEGVGGKTVRRRGYKNLQIEEQHDPLSLSCQPVPSFLEELRTRYGSNVIFFYNKTEGAVIGGLWNPQTGPRSWKVNAGYPTVPMKRNSEEIWQMTINKAATLHGIAELGGDLVAMIEDMR